MPFQLLEKIGPAEVWDNAELSMVPMRDGVKLATSVFLPAAPSHQSAVLVRTPYDMTSRYVGLQQQAAYFNERGYAFVIQDCRGKYRSEGETVPYHFDMADAYDTAEWISAQRWSNQRIGLLGSSYYGYTVWAGVASGHPSIKAAVPQVTDSNMAAQHIGSPWTQYVPNLLSVNDLLQIWTDHDATLVELDFSKRPISVAFDEATAALGRCRGLEEQQQRARTRDFVDPYGDRHPYWTTEIPILHWVSWFDPALSRSGIADYRWFRELPSTRNLHYLHVESADHGRFRLEDVGGGESKDPYYDDDALARQLGEESGKVMDFFDATLGHTDRVMDPRERVRWHLGHVGWRSSEDWPPAGTEVRKLYLSPGGDHDGTLVEGAPSATQTVTWTHDPTDPAPSSTSIEDAWRFLAAYPDVRDRRERPDVLSFSTDALDAPLDLVGEPTVRVLASSSGPSMHLFGVLFDIYPDGTTRQIVRGELVHDQRDFDTPALIKLSPIAYRFAAGHRIELQITSSDYPWYLVHPGTDENPWFAEGMVSNEQTITLGGPQGAVLDLPILKT